MLREKEGVYYRWEDYIGLGRRIIIEIIDVFMAIFISLVVSIIVSIILPSSRATEQQQVTAFLLSCIVLWYLYFVILKKYYRTVGYKIGRAAIVNLKGERPSLYYLTYRFLFLVFGPLNVIVDILWISNDKHRQAIRDKMTYTYVISNKAKPVGKAPLVSSVYHILGMTFTFCEVSISQKAPKIPAKMQI